MSGQALTFLGLNELYITCDQQPVSLAMFPKYAFPGIKNPITEANQITGGWFHERQAQLHGVYGVLHAGH